jgi:hypothetical protein
MAAPEKAGRKPGTFTKDDPRINRTIPGPGRPPDEWKKSLQALADRDTVRNHLKQSLDNGPDDKGDYWKALEYCTKHGFGQPETRHVHAGDEDQPLVIQYAKTVVKERER